jgi:CBS domain containing-hemolysin-like protein
MIDKLCFWIRLLCNASSAQEMHLSREELQHIIESREEKVVSREKDDLNTVVSNIFSLKNKTAGELMRPLSEIAMLSSHAHLSDMRILLDKEYVPYVPIFHKSKEHIVAIAYPRDLLRLADSKKIRDHARAPWFVSESITILQILKQFRKNNQSICVVLNKTGSSIGILTLDEIVDAIFGQKDRWMSFGDIVPKMSQVALDRTFPGDMLLQDLSLQYQVDLRFKHAKTLAQSMELALGHIPGAGESVKIDQFELTVEEMGLLGPKTVLVRTLH